MADIAAAAAATAPPRAQRWRRIAAAALRVLLAVAAYAAVCGLFGALWMGSAANAARVAARLAYGEDSRAVAVAGELRGAAFVAVGLFFFVFCLAVVLDVMLWRRPRASRKSEAREIGGDGGATVPAAQGCVPEGTRARHGVNGRVTRPVIIVVFVVMAVGLLVVLEPAKGSCERVGSMLLDIGSFLISLMFCFVIVPNYAIQMTGGAKGLRSIGIMTHVSFKALGYAILGCIGDFTWPSWMR